MIICHFIIMSNASILHVSLWSNIILKSFETFIEPNKILHWSQLSYGSQLILSYDLCINKRTFPIKPLEARANRTVHELPWRWDSNMKVTFKYLPENENCGCSVQDFIERWTSLLRWASIKKWGLCWYRLLQQYWVTQCLSNMRYERKICKFSVKIATPSWNFSRCAWSLQKFSELFR